jgi:FAD/FMN-containing dehydrogenase
MAALGQTRALRAPIDPRPAAVVEAAGTEDVWAAVAAAAQHDLPLAIRATGHGTHVPSDDGILLDTSAMTTVLVDSDRRVARVGPGATWGAVIAVAAPFGLAPLSGSHPDVGVTGYTLGGGVGWLSRKHGFAADSVLRADVVTAERGPVTASADLHPDLFWALRGGGGNFGVVTALEFQLHPVAQVYGGISYFAIERAADTLLAYRDWIADAPDELSTAVVLTRTADETPVLALKALYAGDPDEAERALLPLRAAAGPALLEGFRPMRYADAAMGGTPPRHLDLLDTLPDELIAALVETGERATVEVRHWGGAMARPAPDAGPVGHRSAPLSVIVSEPAPELAATGRTFLNFLSDTTRTASAYTAADHARLRDVKRAYDPSNLFRIGHNIRPA